MFLPHVKGTQHYFAIEFCSFLNWFIECIFKERFRFANIDVNKKDLSQNIVHNKRLLFYNKEISFDACEKGKHFPAKFIVILIVNKKALLAHIVMRFVDFYNKTRSLCAWQRDKEMAYEKLISWKFSLFKERLSACCELHHHH